MARARARARARAARLALDALEDLRRGRDDVLRVQQLVAAGIADGARGDLVVVGAEEAALTRVDHCAAQNESRRQRA
eukprot:6461589-Prymnesium_polylepis.1